ncbi:MAG: RusA family crossover junction endodeoxyribonuclease [Azospirillum brasilense]|nr:MAG: RusA family crossover junction endodeoxyribonuclease [Azospirillum brasilense]PZR08549.1 MAG: RusA family crossover junction endodeoxyribonuclease [Azospirillum brasilense]
MSVEIEFPVEFIVQGTPVSLQAKRAEAREAWKVRVKEASYGSLPEGHFSTDGPISVTLFYFPAGKMQGDVDNIVKPVLDALCRHIYSDDHQVERVWVQKFEPGRLFEFRQPSQVLSEALSGQKPLLYIRLGDDPTEGLV